MPFKGKLKFLDEVESIREEARKLISQGVKIIIALGHAGFDVDTRIASSVQEVDIVIGGHSNTFLYTGERKTTGGLTSVCLGQNCKRIDLFIINHNLWMLN